MKRVPQVPHPDEAQLQALLWDELDEARALDVQAHLESCAACREAFEELQEFAAVTGLPSDPRELEVGHLLAETVIARARADRWRTAAVTALAASLVLAAAGVVTWNVGRSDAKDAVLTQAPTVALRSGLRATTKVTVAPNVDLLPIRLIPPAAAGEQLYDLVIRDETGRTTLVMNGLRGRGDYVLALVSADTLRPSGFYRLTLAIHAEAVESSPLSFDIEAISD